MAEKIVTIEIDESGNSSIDLEGFQGRGCADVAKDFQGGDKVIRSEKKREYQVVELPLLRVRDRQAR